MVNKTLRRFSQLDKTQQSMLFIFWIYKFVAILTGLYLAVFVYLQTESIASFAMYLAASHTSLMLGFVGFGWFMGRYGISIRYNYVRAFALFFISSLLLVFLPHTFAWLLLYAVVSGLGNGMMWLTIHTLELVHTKNEGRDFYSSMVELGSQVMVVFSPFVATASFLISERVLHAETYFLLFLLLPLAILMALPFLFRIPDYIPERIRWTHVKRFIHKRNAAAHAYYLCGSVHYAVQGIVVPIIAILSLKTAVNLGLTETILGVCAVIVVMLLSHVRNEANRLSLMFKTVCLFVPAYILLFFFDFGPTFYFAYALAVVVLRPILRVSEHVIDLYSVDMLREDGMSFFPALLYRDFILWISRVTVPLAVAGLGLLIKNDVLLLKMSIVVLPFLLLLSWRAAKWLLETASRGVFPRESGATKMAV